MPEDAGKRSRAPNCYTCRIAWETYFQDSPSVASPPSSYFQDAPERPGPTTQHTLACIPLGKVCEAPSLNISVGKLWSAAQWVRDGNRRERVPLASAYTCILCCLTMGMRGNSIRNAEGPIRRIAQTSKISKGDRYLQRCEKIRKGIANEQLLSLCYCEIL